MEDKEYYSNEINLISTSDGPFQWIVGLYQYHEQVNQFQGIRAPLQPELANPRAAPPARTASTRRPVRRIRDRNLQIAGALLEADAYAVFSQIDYQLTDTGRRRSARATPRTRRTPTSSASALCSSAYRRRCRVSLPASTPRSIGAHPRRQVARAHGHRRSRVVAERGHAGLRQVHARLQERRLQRRRVGARPHRLHRAGVHQRVRARPEADFRANA